ncbi:MAG TPA: hypothetical protein PLZ69_02835 [Candidatus Pacearchaeota archaeon]|nr:hypothetical protein [Candidatus Pacearchaeota archaeon]
MDSNIRGSKEVKPLYIILDGRAKYDEDSAEVMECISESEFKKMFNNSENRLQEYAEEEYGGVAVLC